MEASGAEPSSNRRIRLAEALESNLVLAVCGDGDVPDEVPDEMRAVGSRQDGREG